MAMKLITAMSLGSMIPGALGCDCGWTSSCGPLGCGNCKDDGSMCYKECCGHGGEPTPPPAPTPPPGPSGYHQGPLVIKRGEETLNLNVAALTRGLVTSHGNGTSITMKHGAETRAFVVKEAIDDMPVKNYFDFNLLGQELSYDVDLSTVGCSCNAALFFVSSPGYNPDGSVAHGDYNPYYCDANDVGGVWCWEHDTIESNMYTMTSTPHKCTSPAGKYISSCDRGGCGTNAFNVDRDGMCPDARCKIDTRKPFRLHQTYEMDSGSGKLARINNRMVQGSSTFEWGVCNDASYLQQMTDTMKGDMKMVFQLWGDSNSRMSWLDSNTGCSGDCDKDSATVTFSNIELRPLSSANAVVV